MASVASMVSACPTTPRSSGTTTPRTAPPRSATPSEANAKSRGTSASRLQKASRRPTASHSTGRSWTRGQIIDLRLQTTYDFSAASQGRTSTSSQSVRSTTPVRARPGAAGGSGTSGPSGTGSRAATPLQTREPSPRTGSPRCVHMHEGRFRRSSFDLHGWLLAQHGSLQAAFRAMDLDRDGRVDTSDLIEELKRTGTSAVLQAHGKAALRAAQELGEHWRSLSAAGNRGGVGLTEFLEALGGGEERILCARERFLAGEVAEVAYCLPADIAGSSLLDTSRSAGSSPARMGTPHQRPGAGAAAGAAQHPAPLPFLALVPANISSRLLLPNVGAAAALQPIDPLQRSGTLHVRIPQATAGPHEWRLFDVAPESSGQGRQLGAGVPCFLEPPPAPFTPPPRQQAVLAETSELVELRDCGSGPGSASTPRLGSPQLQPPVDLHARCVRSAEADAGTHVRLSWEHRAVGSEGKPTGFLVHWKAVDEGSESRCHALGGHARDCVVGPLYSTNGYKFWMTSVSELGESGPSAKVEVHTSFWATSLPQGQGEESPESPVRVATKPGPVPGVPRVLSRDTDSAELLWTAPEDTGGLPLACYEVHALSQGEAVAQGALTAKVSSCSHRMMGLDRTTSYTFKVRAVGPLGPGPWSPQSPLSAGVSGLTQQVSSLPCPSQLRVLENTAGQVVLSWIPPSTSQGQVLRYRVVAALAATDGKPGDCSQPQEEVCEVPAQQDHTTGDHVTFTLRVSPGRRYTFRVASLGPGSEASTDCTTEEVLTAPAPPSRPGAPLISDLTQTGATLSWEAPSDEGGWAVERYGVHLFKAASVAPEASEGAQEEPRLLQVYVTETARPTHTVEGLATGGSYFARVCAVSAAGAGDFSEASEVFRPSQTGTVTGPPPAPSRPPVAMAVGVPTRAALSWDVPSLPGLGYGSAAAAAPVQYLVMARHLQLPVAQERDRDRDGDRDRDREEACQQEQAFGQSQSQSQRQNQSQGWEVQATTSRTTHTVTGLLPSAVYEFAISVLTTSGQSPPSPPSLPYHTGPRPPGAPGQPWLHGPSSAPPYDPLIAFTMPRDSADAPVRLFRCVAFVDGQPEVTTEVPLHVVGVDGSVVMAAASALQCNCECRLAVQACNDGGWGPLGDSSPAAFVWRPAAPGRPCAALASTGSGLSLVWDAAVDQKGQMIMEYYVFVRSTPSLAGGPEDSPGGGPNDASRQLVRAVPTQQEDAVAAGSPRSVSAEVAGLRRGRSYTFRVQAAEGDEPRPMSEESEPLELRSGAPPPPGRPVAALLEDSAACAGGQHSVRIEWTASEIDGGHAIYGYRVHCHRLSRSALEMFGGEALAGLPLQAPWVESSRARGVAALQGGAQPKLLQAVCSLCPGAAYCFEVQAINGQGASAPSQRSELLQTPSAPPSACRGVVARRSGGQEVCLSWQPPAETGGLPVSSYVVVSRPCQVPGEGTGEALEPTSAHVAAEGQNPHWVRHVVAGLRSGVEYAFAVCAVNGCGRGEQTEAPWTVLIPEEEEN